MGIGNLKGITFPQGVSQHIINQYVDDTSFMDKAVEVSVDYLVGILNTFCAASELEINKQKSVAYWCGRGRPPRWVRKY